MGGRLGLCGLALWMVAATASAQAPSTVVVVAPEPLRETLTEALAVELATRGATVSASRDPAAGDYVVRVGPTDAGLGIELTARRTGRALRIPRLDAVDARSIAVVAASLLDEAREPPPPAPERSLASGLTAPLAEAPPRPPPFFSEASPAREEREDSAPPEHSGMFGVSLGGAFLFNGAGYAAGGGFTTRVLAGYRYRNLLRVAVSLEGAFASQEDRGLEFQPLLMPCLEGSGTIELAPVSVHLGAKACLFVQQWRHFSDEPFRPGVGANQLGSGAGGGVFGGASVYVANGLALWLRADANLVAPDALTSLFPGSISRDWALLGEISLALVIE